MVIIQSGDDEMTFEVHLRADDDYHEAMNAILDRFGYSPSRKRQKERDQMAFRMMWDMCRHSAPATAALAMDDQCVLGDIGGLGVVVHFMDRKAAALFKLTYC